MFDRTLYGTAQTELPETVYRLFYKVDRAPNSNGVEKFRSGLQMTIKSLRKMKFAIGTTIAIAALTTASCALTRSPPKQVDSTNPSVTYQYSDDQQLIEANQQASTYCNQFDSYPQTQSFSSDENGSSIVVFECVSKLLDATSANPPNSDLRYSYRTDQELLEASNNAQIYCVNHGSPELDSTVVENSNGSKTVTFRCNAN